MGGMGWPRWWGGAEPEGELTRRLRRASRDNIMMASAVALALDRLAAIAADDALPLIHAHSELLIKTLELAKHPEEDLDLVRRHLPSRQ